MNTALLQFNVCLKRFGMVDMIFSCKIKVGITLQCVCTMNTVVSEFQFMPQSNLFKRRKLCSIQQLYGQIKNIYLCVPDKL